MKNKKKIIIYILFLVLALFLIFIIQHIYNIYISSKVQKYDNLVSISDYQQYEINFYNKNNSLVYVVIYKLNPDTNKVGQPILSKKYYKNLTIALTRYEEILSQVAYVKGNIYNIDKNNILSIRNENIFIENKEINNIIKLIKK